MPPKRNGPAPHRSARHRRDLCGLFLLGFAFQLQALAARDANASKINFELPPGPAATTLKTFSRQSGEEIIFLVDQVRALKTKGITGPLMPREALDRMLEGSGFSAVQDENTGAFAIRRNPALPPVADRPVITPTQGRVVLLPPIFVEESQLTPPRWRYLQLPGMEVLSCCDDTTTWQLVERIYHLNQRFEAFLPAEFRVVRSAPTMIVLYGETQRPVGSAEMIADMEQPANSGEAPQGLTIRYLPNLRLAERDELAVFYAPKGDIGGASDIHLDAGFIRSLMTTRTPPLPAWFVEGMMTLYQGSSLDLESLDLGKYPFGSAVIDLPSGMFGAGTRRLLDPDSNWKSKMVPVAELFSASPPNPNAGPDPKNDDATRVTEKELRTVRRGSQSALFIHWALNNDDGQSRAAFWKFARRAAEEPVTEAMFKQYFGLGYAELDQRLADYLPKAMRTPIRLYSDALPDLTPKSLRMATDSEISRIKGNLERLEVPYVRRKYPELTAKYLAQARRTLHRAYDQGAKDPGLLEVMGLCECDAGDDATARPFLEAAVKGDAVRPRAYYELARIRLQALRAEDPALRLSAKQTAELMALLFRARLLSPPLPEVYVLIAAVWQQSAVHPQHEDLNVLDEGLGYFPAHLRLIYAVATIKATYGFTDEAAALIERGLQIAPEGSDRNRFLELRSATGPAK